MDVGKVTDEVRPRFLDSQNKTKVFGAKPFMTRDISRVGGVKHIDFHKNWVLTHFLCEQSLPGLPSSQGLHRPVNVF